MDNFFPKEMFIKKYGDDDSERYCEYCGISEKTINKLIDNNYIYTKALWNRGRYMEIDKKDPFTGYNANNIVLSCYWCNNAKTDEFSFEEFDILRNGMKEIWNTRIEKYNKTQSTEDKKIDLIS